MALTFHFVLILALVYGTSFLFRSLERVDIPILAVEILAGIVFGSFFGVVNTETPGYRFLLDLAAFGLLMVMFDAGLELDPEVIRQNPGKILKLAVFTFLLPFLSGIALAQWLGLSLFASFLVGVTVSTTSLGLVYPLLEDFNLLGTDRGQLLLSVAVMNDILSIATLSYGITLVTSPAPVLGAGAVTGILLFFFVLLPFVLADHLSNRLGEGLFTNPVKVGVFTMVLLAFVMEQFDIHAVLGAFFAGLLIAIVTHEGHTIRRSMKPISELTAPVFFFYVGMNVDVDILSSANLELLGAVVLVGIGSKVVGGLLGGILTRLPTQTTAMMTAAVPGRLSMSVAAAEIGRAQGVISPQLYEAFVLLSVISVFLSVLSFRYVVPTSTSTSSSAR